MSPLSAQDRLSRLDDWDALAEAALCLCAHPQAEPAPTLLREAEWAGSWPWPRSTDTRCRAFQAVLKVAVMTATAGERAALAPALAVLASRVIEAVDDVRPVTPAERRDIFG